MTDGSSPGATTDYFDMSAEQWRALRPDLDWDGTATVARLVRVAALLNRTVDHALIAHDLTVGEFDVLAYLRRQPVSESAKIAELAALLQVSPATMTNRTDQLEAGGLVRRQRLHADRRHLSLVLTGRGRALIDAAVATRVNAERHIFSVLTGAATDQLDRALRGLIDGLSRM